MTSKKELRLDNGYLYEANHQLRDELRAMKAERDELKNLMDGVLAVLVAHRHGRLKCRDVGPLGFDLDHLKGYQISTRLVPQSDPA